jgi:cell division septation protein DedD
LWGRSRAGNEIVCLIEGEIEVGAEGEPAVAMNHPLQFYRRVEGKTQPVGNVDAVQLAQWSLETEMEVGKGALRAGGRFSVVLASFPDQAGALAMYDEMRNAGYPAEIQPVKDADKIAYRVRIRNLPSRTEAQALANQLRGKFGITEPRISG